MRHAVEPRHPTLAGGGNPGAAARDRDTGPAGAKPGGNTD